MPLLLWLSGAFAQGAEYVAGEVPDVNFGAPFVLAHDEVPSMWSYTATGADRREWVLDTGVRYATPALEYAAPLDRDMPILPAGMWSEVHVRRGGPSAHVGASASFGPSGLGDVRLEAKYRPLRWFAVVAETSVPTGTGSGYTDGTVQAAGRAVTQVQVGPVTAVLNAGYRTAPRTTFENGEWGGGFVESLLVSVRAGKVGVFLDAQAVQMPAGNYPAQAAAGLSVFLREAELVLYGSAALRDDPGDTAASAGIALRGHFRKPLPSPAPLFSSPAPLLPSPAPLSCPACPTCPEPAPPLPCPEAPSKPVRAVLHVHPACEGAPEEEKLLAKIAAQGLLFAQSSGYAEVVVQRGECLPERDVVITVE